MRVLSVQRGKQYIAVECVNPDCRERLPLAEVPPDLGFDAQKQLEHRVKSQAVICPICRTQATYQSHATLFLLGR